EASGVDGTVVNGGVSAADFFNGTATITADMSGIAFAFGTKETPPATIRLRAADTDGVSSAQGVEAETEVRAARLVIGDASATVLTEAVSNLRVQSYSTTGWTDEPDDA